MERRGIVYCIAILTDQEQEGQNSAEYIRKYCAEKNVFPLIEIYQNQEQFFAETLKTVPTVLFLALPGVAGLNAERFRPEIGSFQNQDTSNREESTKPHSARRS